jgi:DNA-binding sugar fermentation-stimulating protein
LIILRNGQSRKKDGVRMIHLTWRERATVKKVICVHTEAKKYIVNKALTAGKIYEVKNETDEFYYIIDNTGKVGGFYKEYFQNVD